MSTSSVWHDLQPHPYAELLPAMSAEEMYALSQSVVARGFIDPIVLYEGKVLDGRNRLEAARRTGVEPKFCQWDGKGNPLQFVIAKNLSRRQLDMTQKACVGAEMVPEFAKTHDARREGHTTTELVGRLIGCSGRYVRMAIRLKKLAPSLFAECRNGEIKLTAAMHQARRERRIARMGCRITVVDNRTGKSHSMKVESLSAEAAFTVIRSVFETDDATRPDAYDILVAIQNQRHPVRQTPPEILKRICSEVQS